MNFVREKSTVAENTCHTYWSSLWLVIFKILFCTINSGVEHSS